jgi:hypothetical protein
MRTRFVIVTLALATGVLASGTGRAGPSAAPATVHVLPPSVDPHAPALAKLPVTPHLLLAPLSPAAKAAAIATIKASRGYLNIPAAQGPFQIAAGALGTVPSGVEVYAERPRVARSLVGPAPSTPYPFPIGEIWFSSNSTPSAIESFLEITNLPMGNWLVQCSVTDSDSYSVQVFSGTKGYSDTVPLTTAGVVFAAPIADASNRILIWTGTATWHWQGCMFDPVS